MNYKPNGYQQLATPVKLYKTSSEKRMGQVVKTREYAALLYCNVKSYGGTNIINGNELKIEDTVDIVTWYRPDITPDCAVEIDGAMYEIIGAPEDVELRHVWLKFKCKRVKNGC